MSERREKAGVVTVRRGKGKAARLELFRAEGWEAHPQADEGLFRVRVDGRWLDGGRKEFCTPEAVGAVVAAMLGGEGADAAPPCWCLPGERVRWTPADDRPSRRTFVMGGPWRMWSGEWRVLLVGERELVHVDELARVE